MGEKSVKYNYLIYNGFNKGEKIKIKFQTKLKLNPKNKKNKI